MAPFYRKANPPRRSRLEPPKEDLAIARCVTALAVVVALGACARAPSRPPPRPQPAIELEGPRLRTLTLPDRGALEVVFPPEWTLTVQEARPGEEGPPFTWRVEPGDGRFVAFFEPEPAGGAPAVSLLRARALAQRALRAAAEGSVEQGLSLRELRGEGGVVGFWFAATDRELSGRVPSREEWRGLLGGAAAVGDLVVGFTIFDDLPGHHRSVFLDALAAARHLPPEPEAPPSPPAGAAPASELSAAFPGRAWSATVGVPGFVVAAPAASADGGPVVAYAWEPAGAMVATLAIREADGARSAAACRDREWPRIRGAVGGVRGEALWERNGAAFGGYTAPAADGTAPRRWHSRAWYLHDGLCVGVHLAGGPSAPDAGSAEAILGSVRFAEWR